DPSNFCKLHEGTRLGQRQFLGKPTIRFSAIIFDLYPNQTPIASGITLCSSPPLFEHFDASLRGGKTKSFSRCLVQILVYWFFCEFVFYDASEILVVVEWAELLLNDLC